MYNCIKYLYELSSLLLLIRQKFKGLLFNKLKKDLLITLPTKQTDIRGTAKTRGEDFFSPSSLLFSRGGASVYETQ